MKSKKKFKIILGTLTILLAGAIMVAACPSATVKGNGNIIKQERTVGEFTGIDVSSAIDLQLTQGSSQKVVVESDENIIDYIVTEVNSSGVLVIKMKSKLKIKNANKMTVHVTFTTLKSLAASGAASINSNSTIKSENFDIDASGAADIDCKIEATKLILDISGASDINLEGKAQEFKMEVSGASSLIANDFDAEIADIEISGASDAKIKVTKSIKANASGASSLKYTGNPSDKDLNSSGASSIHKF